MGKRILITATVLIILLLTACNAKVEDPVEENEEEIGTGEQEEEVASEDEELGNQEDQDLEDEAENGEDEDDEEENKEEEPAKEDNESEEDNDSDPAEDSKDPEEIVTPRGLEKFYGTWEMEDKENNMDVMVLEISDAKAEIAKDQEDDFEYIRFGYKNSDFFPMEKVIKMEKLDSKNTYAITTVYLEENNSGMYTDIDDEETRYTIELRDSNTLLLSYRNEQEVMGMKFTR